MKKLFYAVCLSSLALAASAGAADNNNLVRKGKGTQKAVSTQGASVRNSPQVNVRRNNLNRPRVQQRSLNTTRFNDRGVVRQNGVRHHDMSSGVTRGGRKFDANHSRKVTVDRQRNINPRAHNRNVEVNRQRNVTRNHGRRVTINNNWRGERFGGRHYAAFRNYHRQWHDRNWWRQHHTRIIFVSGGWYYWNLGYWYPAWGYDPGYYYPYDGPIYSYNSLTPDQVVVNVQTQLQQDGYYSGPVDGLLGPMTRQAIADFQADHGLAITSAVDEPTLASLGLV